MISISIREFCKISISIKYRIDWNLAYQTGLGIEHLKFNCNTVLNYSDADTWWLVSCACTNWQRPCWGGGAHSDQSSAHLTSPAHPSHTGNTNTTLKRARKFEGISEIWNLNFQIRNYQGGAWGGGHSFCPLYVSLLRKFCLKFHHSYILLFIINIYTTLHNTVASIVSFITAKFHNPDHDHLKTVFYYSQSFDVETISTGGS